MEISIQLPKNFEEKTVRELLEQDWLVPRKVRHFLRVRKNITINQLPALFHFPVKQGDVLTLTFEDSDYPIPVIQIGDSTQVTVLFEDEHLIIVNKPIGMKTHPNQPNETNTLLNHLAAYLLPNNQIPYVVHRLDKETSGVIVFAKNPFVLPILGRLLEKKQIYRRYQAIISGTFVQKKLTIHKKIGRDRHDRRKRIIDSKKGAHAVTHIEPIHTTDTFKQKQQQIWCTLDTGRTHQIRVHLASEGHPIIGDPLYHPSPKGRLCLHAYELHLCHPFTNETIIVRATPSLW